MKLRDVETRIKVGESYLEEYDVRDDVGENSKTCYIASEAGKQFVIWNENRSSHDFVCVLHTDGVETRRYILDRPSPRITDGVYVSPDRLRPFVFAELNVTDDENAVTIRDGQRVWEEFGLLRVDFFRVTVLEKTAVHYTTDIANKSPVVLHEKTKKAGSHMVQLGQEVATTKSPYIQNVTYIDHTKDPPFMSFIFRYRPKEMLQAQGILPVDGPQNLARNDKRPGPVDAGPSKRRRTEGEPVRAQTVAPKEENEEVQALLAQRAALDAQIREAQERGIKREPSPITLGAAKGEVIDLTID